MRTRKVFAIVGLGCVLCYLIMMIAKIYNSPIYNETVRIVVVFLLFIVFILSLRFYRTVTVLNFAIASYLLLILSLLIIFHDVNYNYFFDIVFFPFMYFSFYHIFRMCDDRPYVDGLLNFFAVVLTLIIGAFFSYHFFVLEERHGMIINSVYYFVAVLPLLLLKPNNWLVLGCIFFSIIFVVVSGKRGALIFYMLFLFFFSYLNYRSFFARSMFILFFAVFVFIVLNLFGDKFLLRFTTIFSDGGSGRLDLIVLLLDDFFNNNFEIRVIGSGLYSSIYVLDGFTSHSDILEILYSFGFLGLLFYLNIFCVMLYMLKRMLICKYRYSMLYGLSIFMFFGLGLVTHVITFPAFNVLFSILWAFIISDFHMAKNYKRCSYG